METKAIDLRVTQLIHAIAYARNMDLATHRKYAAIGYVTALHEAGVLADSIDQIFDEIETAWRKRNKRDHGPATKAATLNEILAW